MPYTIIKSDGSLLADILDNSVDKVTTDLTLVGKSTSNYGLEFNQNFVKLLENFANPNAPKYPIIGQIWYDTSEEKIRIYTGIDNGWKEPNRPQISGIEPQLNPGDIWIDSTRRQLYFRDGQGTRLAGPIYTAQQGTSGNEILTISDNKGVSRTVVKLMIGGTLIGIFSKETFTPNYSLSPGNLLPSQGIEGEIKKGFTPVINKTNRKDVIKFYVTALNAENLIDVDGNPINVNNFVQTTGNSLINGELSITNDTPLILGSSNNLSFQTSSTLTRIVNNITNSNLAINVRTSSTQTKDAIFINVANNRVGIYNSTPLATLDIDGDVNFRNNIVTNKNTIDIVNTTATTVNFAGAATGVNIGADSGTTTINNNLSVSSNVTIKGGNLNTNLTSFNLLNSTVRTINIGAASSTINVGSPNTGIVNFKNDVDVLNRLTVSGELQVDNVLVKDNTVRSTAGNLILDGNSDILVNKDMVANENLILKKKLEFNVAGTAEITNINVAGTVFNFLPVNVETIYFGSEASLISIGASTSNTYINSDLNINGEFYIGYDDSTPSYLNSKTETVHIFDTKTRNIYIGGQSDNIVVGASNGTFKVKNYTAYFDGDIVIKGDSKTGGAPQSDIRSDVDTLSASIFNENIRSLAIGGAAFNVEIGNTFGQTLIKNDLQLNGSITINGRGFPSKGVLTVGQYTTELDVFSEYVTKLTFAGSASELFIGRKEDIANLKPGGNVTVQHNLKINNQLFMPKLDENAASIGGLGLLFKDDTDLISSSDLVRTYGASRALSVTGDIFLSGRLFGGTDQTAVLWNARVDEKLVLVQGDVRSLANTVNLFIDDGSAIGAQVSLLNLGNIGTTVNIDGNLTLSWKIIRDNYTAAAGDRLLIDTNNKNNNIQVFLPATPTIGDEIRFIDQTGINLTAQLFIRRNGNLINATTNDINITAPGRAFNLVYTGATRGWVYDNN